jgi:hypothetical protein
MDYQAELLKEARRAINEHPRLRSKIIDLYRLAMDEIEDGGSPAHEYELFVERLGDLSLASKMALEIGWNSHSEKE